MVCFLLKCGINRFLDLFCRRQRLNCWITLRNVKLIGLKIVKQTRAVISVMDSRKWLKDLDDRVTSGSKNMAKSLLKIGSYNIEKQSLDSYLSLI